MRKQVLSIKVSPTERKRLDRLAQMTDRTTSYVARRAILAGLPIATEELSKAVPGCNGQERAIIGE